MRLISLIARLISLTSFQAQAEEATCSASITANGITMPAGFKVEKLCIMSSGKPTDNAFAK
jgi:hypothetical protein